MPIPFKKISMITLAIILILTVFCSVLLVSIQHFEEGNMYDIETVPAQKVAIVFGAAVNPNTMLPSDILEDRLLTGINLYNDGKVDKLIMSGDNRVSHYNEPEVMMRYAIDHGIPEEDVVADYAGRRTYDTCYRAKEIFGIDEAILVTQKYHLYRALYTCNKIGVDSVGVSATRQPYLYQNYYNLRETAATLLAAWQVNIEHPKPVLGEKEEVF
jgi:SanA protein